MQIKAKKKNRTVLTGDIFNISNSTDRHSDIFYDKVIFLDCPRMRLQVFISVIAHRHFPEKKTDKSNGFYNSLIWPVKNHFIEV